MSEIVQIVKVQMKSKDSGCCFFITTAVFERLTLFWFCELCWWSSWWRRHSRSRPCSSWLPSRQRWFLRAWSLRWRARRRFRPASLELQSTGSDGTFCHCRGPLRSPWVRTRTGEETNNTHTNYWNRNTQIACSHLGLDTNQPLLTLWVSAEMLVTPFNLKSKGASG